MLNQIKNCMTFTWKSVGLQSTIITGYWAEISVGAGRELARRWQFGRPIWYHHWYGWYCVDITGWSVYQAVSFYMTQQTGGSHSANCHWDQWSEYLLHFKNKGNAIWHDKLKAIEWPQGKTLFIHVGDKWHSHTSHCKGRAYNLQYRSTDSDY